MQGSDFLLVPEQEDAFALVAGSGLADPDVISCRKSPELRASPGRSDHAQSGPATPRSGHAHAAPARPAMVPPLTRLRLHKAQPRPSTRRPPGSTPSPLHGHAPLGLVRPGPALSVPGPWSIPAPLSQSGRASSGLSPSKRVKKASLSSLMSRRYVSGKNSSIFRTLGEQGGGEDTGRAAPSPQARPASLSRGLTWGQLEDSVPWKAGCLCPPAPAVPSEPSVPLPGAPFSGSSHTWLLRRLRPPCPAPSPTAPLHANVLSCVPRHAVSGRYGSLDTPA